MRPNGGGGGVWHLTFTLSPADGTIAPPQESSEFIFNHKKIFKLKILKTMKKIKLFALAIMALLSTNAFAADGDVLSTTVYRYEVVSEANSTAKILGYVADYPAASMATTKIPATLNHPTDADKAYDVIAIAADAFTSVAANITALDLTEAENLVTIPAGTFAGTKVTSLDLSATQVDNLYQLFESVGSQVAEVILPATLTSIEANAFEGLTKLTSIDFTACDAAAGITIKANAFKNTMKITSFEVPEVVVSIEDDAFAGSYITALTINATDDTYPLTVGGGASIGATKITSLTVNGAELTIAADAFADAAKLATVTFNDALASNAVATGAFAKTGTQTITVDYSCATGDDDDDAFAQDAFSAGATDATYVTFKTSEDYGLLVAATNGWATAGNTYGVKLDYTATVIVNSIDVYNNGGSYAYGGFTVPAAAFANGIKIAKKQGDSKDINVMVYGAYFDNIGGKGANSAVIMDQLHLINGYYWIPAVTNIIVKSSSDEPVVFDEMTAAEAATYDSRNMAAIGGLDQNAIEVFDATVWGLGAEDYAINLIDYYNANLGDGAGGYTLYFLRDLEGGKAFGWKQREDDSVIEDGQLFLAFKGTPAARIDVIWADGSEEDATAIQTVKKAAAEKGAVYNLAGQKVNAAYKGVVIKDGQKYIQK